MELVGNAARSNQDLATEMTELSVLVAKQADHGDDRFEEWRAGEGGEGNVRVEDENQEVSSD